MKNTEIYKRLYKDYSRKYLDKIILSAFFSILVAGSTSSIAWLLDPAIKKLFIEKDQSLIIFIPLMIIVAFTVKAIIIINGIKIINDWSFSINNFFIAGSRSHAIAEVLLATNIEKKADKTILFKYFFE